MGQRDTRIATKSRLIYLNGSTDYVEVVAYSSVACSTVQGTNTAPSFDVAFASAA